MAYEYQSFATLGVNLNRQNYGALDISQVFTSQADLNYYISKGAITEGVSTYWYDASDADKIKKVVPYPYAGQYVALVDNATRAVTAYILAEKEDGTFETKEVGKAPIGDNKSIEVATDGTISIKGFDDLTAAEIGYLPQVTKVVDKEADDETGAAEEFHLEIQWKPVSAVVEGDGNTVTKITSTDGSVTVTESQNESTDTLTYDLKITQPNIPEYAIKADERTEDATSTTYHLTKDDTDVGVAIVVPDAYDDTALSGRVDAKAEATNVYTKTEADNLLNAKANAADVYNKDAVDGLVDGLEQTIDTKANKADVYTKTETDTKIGEAVAAADHLKRKIVANKDAIQTYIDEHDDAEQYIFMVPTIYEYTEESNKYDEYIVLSSGEGEDKVYTIEPVGSWSVDLADYVSETELADKLKDYSTSAEITQTLAAYATTAYVSGELGNYYTKTQADELLAKYYTAEAIDDLLEPLATKTELANKADQATTYTKDEVDGLLNNKANAGVSYTKEEANALLADKANVGDSYTKEEANTLLEDKANVDDVYNKTEVYSKTEVDELIGVPGEPAQGEEGEEGYVEAKPGTGIYQHIYSKDEVTDLIADITGGESAADVKAELTAYKTSNDTAVNNLKTKLDTVESGAEVNAINSVDANEFTVVTDEAQSLDRQLQLVSVPVKKLNGLDTNDFTLDTVNNKLTINKVAVGKLEGLGNEFAVEDNTLNLKAVPVSKLSGLDDSKITIADGKLTLKENYVTTSIYVAEVGDLNKLIHASGKADATLVDEINDINERLTWGEMVL